MFALNICRAMLRKGFSVRLCMPVPTAFGDPAELHICDGPSLRSTGRRSSIYVLCEERKEAPAPSEGIKGHRSAAV